MSKTICGANNSPVPPPSRTSPADPHRQDADTRSHSLDGPSRHPATDDSFRAQHQLPTRSTVGRSPPRTDARPAPARADAGSSAGTWRSSSPASGWPWWDTPATRPKTSSAPWQSGNGSPAEVAQYPRTDYVARLVGLSPVPASGIPFDDGTWELFSSAVDDPAVRSGLVERQRVHARDDDRDCYLCRVQEPGPHS